LKQLAERRRWRQQNNNRITVDVTQLIVLTSPLLQTTIVYFDKDGSMQPLIVQGDTTSHGGRVIGGSPFSSCEGKPYARIGDMVACAKCKGVFPIVEGIQSFIIDCAPVAHHGCRVACGATLISSQTLTFASPSFGEATAAGAGDAIPSRFGAIGAAMATYEERPSDETNEQFHGRFQLVSIEDGKPIANQPARIRAADGQYVDGTTDTQGYTAWVQRGAEEALSFELTDKPE
jgi:uncharacterized Zn-binding protein involved in type VI secretion